MYALTTREFSTPKGNTVRMTYREDTNDYNTLNASLTEDEYGLRSEPRIAGHAVDVGGYLGSVGIGLAVDWPGLNVTIIEPLPPNAELIRANIALNGVGVQLIEGAVGSRKPVTIAWGYEGSTDPQQEISLLHHAFVGNSTLVGNKGLTHQRVTYEPTTLASLGPVDFMKIDCEGGEWDFLTGPLENVALIVGEWHPTKSRTQSMFATLLAPTHDVTFNGPIGGPGGFRAVRR